MESKLINEVESYLHGGKRIGYWPREQLPYGEWLSLGDCTPNPDNPPDRMRLDGSMRKLLESLKRFGQVEPISISINNNQFLVDDGNRRWFAARQLEWAAVWGVLRERIDATLLMAIKNTTRKTMGGKGIGVLAATRPDILQVVPDEYSALLRQAVAHLGDDYPAFSRLFGPRGVKIARRVLAHVGWDEQSIGLVLRYMTRQGAGVMRRLEEAMSNVDPIASGRLIEVITSNESLKRRW